MHNLFDQGSHSLTLGHCATHKYKEIETSLTELSIEPVHEKTNNLGFRPGPTQTRLYSHRSRLEA